MVLVSYMLLTVGVRGSLHYSYIDCRRSHVHIPVMLFSHLVKIVFPSYYTCTAYLSCMNVHNVSHREARSLILFIILGSVADLLALAGSL